jgi:hypothetical protein
MLHALARGRHSWKMLEDRSDLLAEFPESPGGGWVHGRYAAAREEGLPGRKSAGKRLQWLRGGRWQSRPAVRWGDGHGERGLAGHWHVDGVSLGYGQLVIPLSHCTRTRKGI